MRVDIPTQPFPPAITERHERWPAVNDLDDNSLPADSADTHATPAPRPEPSTPAPPPRPVTRVETRLRPAQEEHAALPPVGDFWDLENPTPLPVSFTNPVPVFRPLPYSPPVVRRTVAPAASVALTTGVLAIPMTLVLGLGAILGMVAIVSGIVAIKQVRRTPTTRKGTPRAVTGIVCGAGSVVVGGPILLFLALILGL